MSTQRQYHSAFTLIELLIVVAIIAILAAIAVPNFLEAQTRSKVSRVKAEHRTLKLALESYSTDYNKYPTQNVASPTGHQFPEVLTSPVAYMASLSSAYDLFKDPLPYDLYQKVYHYWNWRSYFSYFPATPLDSFRHSDKLDSFLFYSWGPDTTRDWIEYYGPYGTFFPGLQVPHYDPTNGTVSRGDIASYGP